ncbi:MAG: hypothetical protein AAFW69_02295 [Pseudomonadota bacterium]
MPRFITKTMHAYIDYPVALSLIALPFLLGLGASSPLAVWLSVATGVAAFVLTVLTDHKTGVVRVLPYRFHLIVDGAVGAVFLVAPFVLGFAGIDLAYYLVMGGAVVVVVGLHKPEDEALPVAA